MPGQNQNNLLLNPDKNNLHSVHTRPCRIYEQSGPNNKQQSTTHGNASKGFWVLTLDPKLTYSTHIHNISAQAHKPLQIIKALTATGWGKQKETLMATYKAVMRTGSLSMPLLYVRLLHLRPALTKYMSIQNAALRTATGCTQDTNMQHLHDETLTLPIHEHLQLHASQYKQKTQYPSHPLHKQHNILQHSEAKKHYF